MLARLHLELAPELESELVSPCGEDGELEARRAGVQNEDGVGVRRGHDAPRSTTAERGSARYRWPDTVGACSHSTMSCGESRNVSIQRRHGRAPSGTAGSSDSSASQYALRMTW